MSTLSITASQPDPADPLHSRFLMLVPRIEMHARIYFRDLKCQAKKDDAIAETIAHCLEVVSQPGRKRQRSQPIRDRVRIPGSSFRQKWSPHLRTGKGQGRDEPPGQQRHGFVVHSLPISTCAPLESLYSMPQGQEKQDAFEERLQDNTQTPVPDQAAFRCDFPAWRLSRTDRDRRVIDDLGMGERTLDVSKKYGISPGRISQLRRDFMDDWERFTADPVTLSA